MPSCIVRNCRTNWRRKEENIILHCFPKNLERIKLWLHVTGQFVDDLDYVAQRIMDGKVHDSYRICSKHFVPGDYTTGVKRKSLRKDAIPTLFPKEGRETSRTQPPMKRKRVEEGQAMPSTEVHRKGSSLLHDTTQSSSKDVRQTSIKAFPKTSATDVSETGLESFFGDQDKEQTPKTVKSLTSVSENGSVKPYKRNRVSRWTSVDPSIWMSNKRVGTKVKTQVKAIQAAMSTRSVGVQCCIFTSIERGTHNFPTTSLLDVSTLGEVPIEKYDVTYELSNLDTTKDTMTSPEECSEEEQAFIASPEIKPTYIKDRKFIVFESCLNTLLKLVPCQFGVKCTSPIDKIWKQIQDSFVSVHVRCKAGHSGKLWDSQPKEGRLPVGDVMLACATLLSGSNFSKIDSFSKILNMSIISRATYYRYQKNFLYPAVDRHWKLEQAALLEQFSKQAVCLSGDCQCDSPGHNAKYCTYTFMEATSKKIVGYSVKQVTPGTSNVALKTKGFVEALEPLLENGVDIGIICTDRHVSVRNIMRDKYPDILHQFDVWHLAKSVGAKVLSASRKRECQELSSWVAPIMNHLRWCASHCNMDPDLLKEMWCSILYHCVNKHTWEGAFMYTCCEHSQIPPDLQRQRQWLRDGSKAHSELKKIVLREALLEDMINLSNFCHTGDLKGYHSTALKYIPKRNHFFLDGMNARTQLAILDHNSNVGRAQATVKKKSSHGGTVGKLRYKSRYSKGGGDWVFKNIYDPKSIEFVFNILQTVLSLIEELMDID